MRKAAPRIPLVLLLMAAPFVFAQTPAAKPAADNDQWHITATPYLWFPAMHGEVGTPEFQASVHASAIDLLSDFRFGLMGDVTATKKRLVTDLDMFWVRLADSRQLNVGTGQTSVDVKMTEFFLTPKIGYRLVDQPKFKADAMTGFRYWHIGQNVSLDPNRLGRDLSGSVNFVDPLVGGRIQTLLSPKVVMNIGGDVGGWGTGSQLEYQMIGMLGYRIKPTVTLQVAYRYISVDYRSSKQIIDVITPGLAFGVSFDLK